MSNIKQQLQTINIGATVGFKYGPGEFPEDNVFKVTQKVEDRWGFHLVVENSEGETKTVSTMLKMVGEHGIGAYLLSNDADVLFEAHDLSLSRN